MQGSTAHSKQAEESYQGDHAIFLDDLLTGPSHDRVVVFPIRRCRGTSAIAVKDVGWIGGYLRALCRRDDDASAAATRRALQFINATDPRQGHIHDQSYRQASESSEANRRACTPGLA